MSNTEETPETSQKRSSYVDEFLESGRKKARSSLSTEDNQHIEDLEYMLKSVRALVKIINEIWDNCEEHLSSSEENKSPFTFEREIFEEVKVKKKGRNLIISTRKVFNTKDFGSLPVLPEGLKDLIHVNQAESIILPDYNRYIEKSSIMCEELLLPFLTSFQKHLKETHVFLGKIEEWLIEPEVVDSFLNQTFDGPGCVRCESKNDPSIIGLYFSYCLDVNSKMESTYNLCTEKGREVVKATLTYIKFYQPVTQVEVKGAGEEAVNGAYTLNGNGTKDGVCYYSRSGLWDGKSAKFLLFRYKSKIGSNEKAWRINCRYETGSKVKF